MGVKTHGLRNTAKPRETTVVQSTGRTSSSFALWGSLWVAYDALSTILAFACLTSAALGPHCDNQKAFSMVTCPMGAGPPRKTHSSDPLHLHLRAGKAAQLRVLKAFIGEPSSIPSTHIRQPTAGNPSSRGSGAIFWPLYISTLIV